MMTGLRKQSGDVWGKNGLPALTATHRVTFKHVFDLFDACVDVYAAVYWT